MPDATDRVDPTERPMPVTPQLGDSFPLAVRVLVRNSVPVILLAQTLARMSRLDAGDRGLALGLCAVTFATWIYLTTNRKGHLGDQLALIIAVGCAVGLNVMTGGGQVYVAGYAACFVAPFWYGIPDGLAPYLSAVAAVLFSSAYVGKNDVLNGVGNGIGAAFFGLAALFWGRVLRASRANAELVAQLRESQDSERRSAVVAERARLARELHDVLAHTLSSLSLHLESTRVLARSRGVDDEVLARIDRGVSLARTGLEEARSAVGTLRDDELPGPERLASLVTDFARTSGVECRFEESGTPTPLVPEARVALFRSAQEALTNVGKHAHASTVNIDVDWLPDEVVLRVVDDGRGVTGSTMFPGGGNGLRGMRERAELAGGSLLTGPNGPTGGGFAVEVRLPT